MKWNDIKVGKKIIIGIGSVLVLLVVLGVFSVKGIGEIVFNGKEVAYGNNLARMVTEKEIDHLNWAAALSKFLNDKTENELELQKNHKLCAFGKWLYGDDRKLAETKVPALKSLFKSIEEPHKHLHESATSIDRAFVRADHSLPELFARMELAHVNWAETALRQINSGYKKLEVQLNDHKCGFGKFIYGEEGKQLGAEHAKIGSFLERIKDPHNKLHNSAKKISELLSQGNKQQALQYYLDNSVVHLTQVRSILMQMANIAVADINNEKVALDIYQNNTLPALENVRAKLAQIKVVAGENIMSEEVMIAAGYSTQVFVLIISICALVIGVVMAFFISKAITGPINKLMNSILQIERTADFNERCGIDSKDEIGLVSKAFDSLVISMQSVIVASNRSMSKVAAGDFSQRIDVEAVGDLQLLKAGINTTVDNINNTFVTLNDVMQALSQANYSRRIDMSELEGEYKGVVNTGLESMNNSGAAITAINSVMSTVASGEFDKRISIALPGDLGVLKDNINESLKVVENGIVDTTRITVALSKGDLKQRVEADHPGQFGVLKNALNETMDNLREVVSSISSASNVVQSASNEIADGNADMSKRTEEQASSLEETASSMEELTSTVQQNAENADQANQLSKGAAKTADQGGSIVKDAVSAMDAISTSSNRIVDIIGVIDEIAFQTNLLALNASVEAARAGEQGRGFAVVATEVRNLAQRSATAAKEIKDLIQDSVGKVKIGSDLVEKSGETLGEIVQGVKKVGDMIAEIAAASQEQTVGIAQINQAITNMDDITQRNAALAEEASANSENLNSQATKMNKQVQFFDLGQTHQQLARKNKNEYGEQASHNIQLSKDSGLMQRVHSEVEEKLKAAAPVLQDGLAVSVSKPSGQSELDEF